MSAQTKSIVKNSSITKVISSQFPRLNKESFLETAIEKTYVDTFLPINSYDNDNFVEFRLPASISVYTDLSQLILQFHIIPKKKIKVSETWSQMQDTVSGDHFDILNFSSTTIWKHMTITMNGVQIVNDPMHTYSSYIKLLSTFPEHEISKIGKLYHIENYKKIYSTLNNDDYFIGLDATDPVAERLSNLRQFGAFCRAPLLPDIAETDMYLLDGIDISIKLDLHDTPFIVNTSQHQENLAVSNPKKYYIKLNNVKLDVTRIIPKENAYNGLMKSLMPMNDKIPTIDYLFTSKLLKQYHLPNNINEYIIDMPYNQTIPEKIVFCFLKYDAFNTSNMKENGLYLSHLNLKRIYITLNGSTLYNIECDFEKRNILEIYDTTLRCINKDNLLSYEKFIEGSTIFGLNLVNFDTLSTIREPYYGAMRITLNFKDRLADNAVMLMFADVLSSLSINFKREIIVNRN